MRDRSERVLYDHTSSLLKVAFCVFGAALSSVCHAPQKAIVVLGVVEDIH